MMRICSVSPFAPTAAPPRPWHATRPHRPCLCAVTRRSDTRLKAAASTAVVPTSLGGPAGRRLYRSSSASDAGDVQSFLQNALAYEAAAAGSVTIRAGFTSSTLQLSTCQGWVTYLLQLAAGDSAAVRSILQLQPKLLSGNFDQQRHADLAQLQHLLLTSLNIEPPDFFRMVRRAPLLLWVPPQSAAASINHLGQLSGDLTALRKAVVARPRLLTSSVPALQERMEWLTGKLGAAPVAALRMLPEFVGSAIGTTLEPHRLWFLQQGFTPAQALRLAHFGASLFSSDTALLQRRLEYFTHTCGVPADGVRCMLAAQPGVWTRDLEGHLMRLKLQYWQDELRYSLSDLVLVPPYLGYGLSRIACRHSLLRDLLGSASPPASFLAVLIPGSTATAGSIGPMALARFVRQHPGRRSVQDVIAPLSARLSQPVLRKEWLAVLQRYSDESSAPTSQRHALYAALLAIYERDWALSAAGRRWTAAEAEAKAADSSGRVEKHAKQTADAMQVRLGAAAEASGAKAAARTRAASARGAARVAAAEAVAARRAARAVAAEAAAAAGAAARQAVKLAVRAAKAEAVSARRVAKAAVAAMKAGKTQAAGGPLPKA